MNYPFNEGDYYFTIDNNTIVESVWDEQSEELFSPDKMYFETLKEAIFYYKMNRYAEMLESAVNFIETTNERDDFMQGYEYFNVKPKISLL
jgi:hypothetical protein